VGATNPNDLKKQEINTSSSDYTGGVDKAEDSNEYIVRDLIPSLKCVVMNIGNLVEDQEKIFLAAYLFDGNLGLTISNDGDKVWKSTMLSVIAFSQDFVRRQKIHRVAVSIRDLVRTLQLYKVCIFPKL
jgi:hypothetical protein